MCIPWMLPRKIKRVYSQQEKVLILLNCCPPMHLMEIHVLDWAGILWVNSNVLGGVRGQADCILWFPHVMWGDLLTASDVSYLLVKQTSYIDQCWDNGRLQVQWGIVYFSNTQKGQMASVLSMFYCTYIFILVCSIIYISIALFSLLHPSGSNRLDVLETVPLLLLLINFCVPFEGATVA